MVAHGCCVCVAGAYYCLLSGGTSWFVVDGRLSVLFDLARSGAEIIRESGISGSTTTCIMTK